MVRRDKLRPALRAIHAVLVVARSRACAGDSIELADVLDTAEYLPMLMLEPIDRTAEFRAQLAGLVDRRADFRFALEMFDREPGIEEDGAG